MYVHHMSIIILSGWLTVGPSKQYGFDLSREMFRDRLNLRHGQELRGLPSVCDGCGAPFSLEHALNCKKGGNIKLGHDQVRDECIHLCTMAYGAAGVKKEPFLREASGNVRDKDLRADFLAILVCGRGRGWRFFITAFWMLTHPLVLTATQAMSLPCVRSSGEEDKIPGAL